MLRNLLLGFGALLVLIGLGVLLATRDPGGFGPLLFGVLVLLGTLLERRYRPATGRGKGQRTDERFVDPVSGELMEVWYDPATGERSYVKVEGGRRPPG